MAELTRREKFASVSRMDKLKRSALYKEGQCHLWIKGRKIKGPVKLLGIHKRGKMGVDGALSERIWICELMWCDEQRIIGEYDLGIEVNEMEAIAWASI